MLRLGECFDQVDQAGVPAGQAQVIQRDPVHREIHHRCPGFRRHVGDHRPVSQRQAAAAIAEHLDEAVHHAGLAQQLHDSQRQVGRHDALAQAAGQFKTEHIRSSKFERLPEHGCQGFDPAHTPAGYSQPVDHGGV